MGSGASFSKWLPRSYLVSFKLVRSMIANAKYVSKNIFTKKLWILIFNGVKDLERVTKLVKSNQSFPSRLLDDLDNISEHVSNAKVRNYIIEWHIANEIWYNKDKQFMSSTTPLDPTLVDQMEFNKILFNYMLYLLLNRPNLMSIVAMVVIAQMILAETLHELWHLIGDATKDLNGLCEKLYNGVRVGMHPRNPTNALKFPLAEGLLFAHLPEDAGETKWLLMSNAWLQFLQYAAINIKGETHVRVLSKGRELLTFVWLLMVHLGRFFKPEWGWYHEYFEEKFAINERDDRDDSDHSVVSAVNNESSA